MSAQHVPPAQGVERQNLPPLLPSIGAQEPEVRRSADQRHWCCVRESSIETGAGSRNVGHTVLSGASPSVMQRRTRRGSEAAAPVSSGDHAAKWEVYTRT